MPFKYPGYNNRKSVTYKGVTYTSYTAAGAHFGLSPPAVKDRLAKGYPLEVRSAHRLYHENKKKSA